MQNLRSIMTSEVCTVHADQTCQEAAQLMSEHNIGAIPVVDHNGSIVGMVTDRDITLRATADGDAPQTKVSEVMSSGNIVQATPDMDIHEAAQLMADSQIRRLPVVENGQIVGMVALGDLATENQYSNEAEEALTDISKPSAPRG